ncbi:MAG: N-acetylmuramoyl-L-alanine amidase [Solirubrobacterales bacterium]|nr:N-acetylmuramoyl-L-alanine amidase [Solirubrobacterales bacterium]
MIAAGGCGSSGDNSNKTATEAAAKPASDSATDKATLWFTAGEQFHPVEREIPKAGSAASGAVEALLAGPSAAEGAADAELTTQIPAGTTLDKLTVGGGTATVRVSPSFLDGIETDPAARDRAQNNVLAARLAQVTYTATQFADIKAARVIAGGTLVNAAVSRADYAEPTAKPAAISKPKGPKLPGTRQVQTKLAKLGYLPKNAVDGRAGYQTQQAVIAFQAWNGLGRDGVVGPATSAALKTATRPRPQAGGAAKRIEVYRDKGVALLIDGGRLVRAIHVSSGGPATPTPSGTYKVFRKELNSWSVPFSSWLPFASYFNNGIAFHEYADVPAYPASHGCVRVPAPEAKYVYDFAAVGTAIVVI